VLTYSFQGAFCLYAGFNVVAFFMIFLWVPETKQRTLEELDYVFGLPTARFVNYQITKAGPWWFKRWVLFQKDAVLEPLYHFDSGHTSDVDDGKAQTEYSEMPSKGNEISEVPAKDNEVSAELPSASAPEKI
jgi:hypothetical protein